MEDLNMDTKTDITTNINNATYQGKWGYYCISYETFKKLRELNKWYHMTLRDLGRWVRWNRKTIHRYGAEPKYCHTFVLDKADLRSHVNKEGYTVYRWYPKTCMDYGICGAYQLARMPKKTVEEVEHLEISEDLINRLHSEASVFFKT